MSCDDSACLMDREITNRQKAEENVWQNAVNDNYMGKYLIYLYMIWMEKII